METHVIKIENPMDQAIELNKAGEAVAQGKLVVFPTETVYGLGANALDKEAVDNIFEAKGRPSDNPLIVHIAELEQLKPLVKRIPDKAKVLIESFWPGPLTMVFEKSDKVPDSVTAGLSTVAVRMPDHPIAISLIASSGVPVAAPSANLSGKPSPTKAEHVVSDLYGRVDYIIDGGDCRVGLESTVLDVTSEPPVILRPGGVTKEMLEAIIGKVSFDKVLEVEGSEKPKSPGMKYRHYAPEAEMVLITGQMEKVIEKITHLINENKEKGKKIGVLSSLETKERYHADLVLCAGSIKKMEDVASQIYSCLRQFDEEKVDMVLAEGFSEEGLGQAVMNRLKKAASGKIIEV